MSTTPQTAAVLPPEQHGYIPDKLKKAEKRIAQIAHDTEAWSVLIRDAQMRKIEEARQVYERLVAQFPNAGKYWRIYIEQELKCKNFERVEKLFQRCLVKVLSIDLWKLYLSYIKDTKDNLPSYREKMAQAYDFALDKMGMDIMSYNLWVDYINFLKAVEAVGSYAENQRITAVRKVYQRGVVNPMINIEALWKDYCAYETNINPLIAKKMTEDRGRDYMNARRVAKEYEAVTRGLNKNLPSVPPQNSPEEAQQVDLWKKYISWEKSNPLRTEDHALITKRVMFAYEQCLLCLGHHPDIWYEAASYLEQSSKILTEKGDQNAGKMFADEAAAVYERAITTLMKNNMLVYFAYADFEEGRMKYEKVHNIYKRLLAVTDIDPTLGYVQYMKFARRAEGIKSARLVFKMAREDNRTRFQVFVAASLMEYYCSKEKTVALKIFELGLKKYGGIPEYVLCYMEFMSHLNEDNNTRVLYERVLSSGQIQPEKSIEIWSRFLAFESEVGDLASIQKVEKRRTQAIEKVQEFEGKDTALLIDRYKYLDLYPCSQSELKALGYYDLAKQRVVQLPGSEVTKVVYDEEEGKKAPEYPKPDIEQMLPFKPRQNTPNGSHPVPGGVFPPPPAAANLLTLIPPPDCFHGPFVVMDKFIEQMKNLVVPDGSPYDTYPLHVEEIHHGGPEMEEVTNNMQVQDNNILIVSNDVQFFNEKFSKESDRIDLQQNRNGRFYLDSREDTMLGPACKSTDLYVENESIELRENKKKKKRKKKQQMNEMQSKVTSSVSVMKDEDILTDEGTYDTIRKVSANVEDVCSTSSLDSDLTGQDNSDMEQDLKDQSDSERESPLEKIQRIVWPDKGMECHVPGCITKKYSNIRTYHQKHWKAVHEPLVIARKCPECQQIYKKNTNFKKHMVKIHGKNRRKMKNWVAKCLVKLPNPDYISPGTLLAPVLPRRHDYRKTDNSRRKGDDELVELAFSDTEDDYEEEISDQSNSVNSLKKFSVRCQNNQDFNLERNAGNFCHIQDTEKIQQPDSQNEFHLMTENIDSLNIQTETAHDTGITEKHRNLQIGHASDSENIVQSNLESQTDEEIVVQSNLETQPDTEYIDQCNLETQPDIKNNDQSKLETQPDPDIKVPSASKQRKIEKVIWPEGGMACHIPGCHSEVFYYWKDYMNLHWYKVHKQTYRLYICPKCGYETNNMDELKKHVRIAHKIKKRGEIRQLVDGCRRQVQNKLYIPTNGMYPPVRKQREIMTAGKDDQLECFNTEDVLEDKVCLPTSVTMVTDTEIINKKIIEMIERYIPVGYRGPTKGIRKQCPGQSEPQSQMYQDIEKCSHKDIEIQSQMYRAEPPQIQSKVETSTSMAESQMPVHSAETLSKSKVVSVTCKIEPQTSGYNMKHSSEITPQRVPCKIEPQSPESSIENPSEFTAGRLTFKVEPQSPEFSIENPSKVTQVCCTENSHEQIPDRIVFPVEGMPCHVPGCDTVIFKSIGEFMKYHWNFVHKPTIQYATCPKCTMIFIAKNPLKSHLVSKHKMKKVDAVQVLDKNLREAPNPIYVSPGGIGPPRMWQPGTYPMTVDSKSNTLEDSTNGNYNCLTANFTLTRHEEKCNEETPSDILTKH